MPELDLTDDKPNLDVAKPLIYDPRPQEDSARRTIAYALLGLLAVVLVSCMIFVGNHTIKMADLKEFSVVLGPVVTLVSAATGFYYGTKSNNSGTT